MKVRVRVRFAVCSWVSDVQSTCMQLLTACCERIDEVIDAVGVG